MAGLLAVAGIAAIGGSAVLAQEGQDGASFLDRVAARLGIETSQLEQAIQDARGEELDAAVAEGDLTQEQADELKERLDDLPADAPFFGPRSSRGGEFKFGFGRRLGCPGLGATREELAGFLGIAEDELRQEMEADGATLGGIAEAHGKSRDDLRVFLLDQLRTKLNERVAQNDLTQGRADEIIAKAEGRIGELIDRPLPNVERFKFRFPDGDGDGGEEDAPSPDLQQWRSRSRFQS